jgi:hypothetical protein
MEDALITLAIGMPQAARTAQRIFAAYADRHGLAFEVITAPRYRIRPNLIRKRLVWYHIEKFQLFDAFDRYRRILFLDSDILIAPDCPNLLELVPAGELGCVFDDRGADAWKREAELRRLERRLGALPAGPRRYFNSGVMVLDGTHKALFEMDRKAFIRGRWPEQTLLNYRVLAGQYRVHELPSRYNFLADGSNGWEQAENRRKAGLVHYAGPSAKGQFAADAGERLRDWGVDPSAGVAP